MNKLQIRIPGSSGNVGPGFDTLALAFNIYCKLTLEIDENFSKGPVIELKGNCIDDLPKDDSNLILKLIKKNLTANGHLLKNLKITIDNDIPLARGLGSSSAAGIGAIWAAQWLSDEPTDKDVCVQKISKREGHAENSAASALGGLVSVSQDPQNRFRCVSIPWPDEWATIVTVPDHEVSTPVARKVLPKSLRMNQAVTNIQNTSMLIWAVLNKDKSLLQSSLHDTLHEPYRESLTPELSSIRSKLKNSPALGTVLSGAGPSVLTIVERKYKDEVTEQLEDWKRSGNPGSEIFQLFVDYEGLVVELG